MKIIEALKTVRGETDASVDAMIQILAANDFCADDPADGAFRSLSESLLLGMHFTPRQVAAIIEAQRSVTRGDQSLMDLLKEAPPRCPCTATSSSSHTPNVQLPNGFTTQLWGSLDDHVMRDINGLRTLLESRRVPCGPGLPPPLGAVEAQTNAAFNEHVMTPVNIVLYDIAIATELSRTMKFQLGCEAVLNRHPDFGLYDVSANKRILLACGEGKTATALDGIDDIVGAFNGGVAKVCQQVIPQVYCYSAMQGLRYVWLTDYERLWVIKMEDEFTMLISRPFLSTDHDPSVRQVMFWLALQAKDPEGGKLKVRQLFSQVPISRQLGRGTQGGEAGPSTSGGPAHNTRSKAGGQAAAPAPQGSRSRNITPVQAFGPLTDLGYGESGTVSAGRLNGRDVAIKFGDRFNSKDVVRRLEHEADVYGRLQHLQGTCIPHLEGYGLTEYGTIYFLATRLIKGSHCKEGGMVSHAQRRAAEQALTAIHRAGFLHGDIRPGNLIFEEATGKAVLLDLGFSKACTCAEEHEAELQELRTMLTPSPTSVHAWPRSQGHNTDGAGFGNA